MSERFPLPFVRDQLGPFLLVNSPCGNDSEMSDTSGVRKSGLCRPERADWLIAACHSNFGDTLILAQAVQPHDDDGLHVLQVTLDPRKTGS